MGVRRKSVTWKTFAHDKEIARQRKEMFPLCEPTRSPSIEYCPVHGDVVGPISRICLSCFHEGWEWTAEKWKEIDPERADRNQVDMR